MNELNFTVEMTSNKKFYFKFSSINVYVGCVTGTLQTLAKTVDIKGFQGFYVEVAGLNFENCPSAHP